MCVTVHYTDRVVVKAIRVQCGCYLKPKFHYADFVTRLCRNHLDMLRRSESLKLPLTYPSHDLSPFVSATFSESRRNEIWALCDCKLTEGLLKILISICG